MCQAFPEAVAAGLGLRPVRLHCGVSARAESEGERLVRADVCPLVKSLLGNVASGSGLHAEVDLWLGLYTCDQMRRALFVLSDELGREVHPVQLPSTRTEEAAQYYAAQIRRFVSDAEALYGIAFDPRKALEWRAERVATAEVLNRAARSGAHSPLDMHLMFHLFFVARPHGLAGFFEKATASTPPFESSSSVVLAGSPLGLEDTVVLETLAAHGISVVPLNCTGLNSTESTQAFKEDDTDVIGTLAREAFLRPPCARARPNTPVYDRLRETLSSTGASGLIVKCLKFCDHWYTERKRMSEEFDLPVLFLDSAYSKGERERLIGRVEAFAEMLKGRVH
jgi:benzoyl-CoA reductase/2-hydroxyglutaryl-CoA dehydratase subunit BcrC/BadD/HgdB